MVGLRCVVFYCDWYDTTPDRGVKTDAFGVTSVHSRRKIQYYDSFILASQSDQLPSGDVQRRSIVEDLADVELVENFAEFGLDAVVHSEDEAEVGDSRPSGSSHEQNLVPAYVPAPYVPAPYVPAPAAQEDLGVMSVQQLVQQPGREHLPVLHTNPRPGHTT
uniref:DUF4216 domain-containing protein n=1 Tax=Brassica oleracea var. oleracea TaxID=109376 RepID=A0A0D3APS4_BRAOL